jgi:hypothetical protein
MSKASTLRLGSITLSEQVTKNKIEVDYCPTDDQVADVLTKAMKRVQFMKFRRGLGVVAFDSLN